MQYYFIIHDCEPHDCGKISSKRNLPPWNITYLTIFSINMEKKFLRETIFKCKFCVRAIIMKMIMIMIMIITIIIIIIIIIITIVIVIVIVIIILSLNPEHLTPKCEDM